MAVGFAEGEFDPENFIYTVRSRDSHAWPEVFFPGIGWIEFEPTGNQSPLVRPDRPEEIIPEDNTTGQETPTPIVPDQLPGINEREAGLDNSQTPIDEAKPIYPLLYTFLALLVVGLIWYLNRQYAFIEQIPTRLQVVYERNGGQSPAWINNWAHWNALSPIERSFETINRSLRLLGASPALFHTPSERAEALISKLPKATGEIETLTEQHMNSMFSPRPGDVSSARRASFRIWLYTLQSIFQRIIEGPDQ
jgi:hypothetical protein